MRLQHLTGPFAVTVVGFVLGLAPASEPPPMSDVILARNVLAAIDADKQLKDVNLVVSVVDRVAVIGGPVTSAEVSKKAETVVRGVAGIAEVKNGCFVEAKPDPLIKAVAERIGFPNRPLLAELPAVVPPRNGVPSAIAPPGPETTLVAHAVTETEVVVRKPAYPTGLTGVLGSPAAPAPPVTTAALKPPAVLTSLSAKGSDLLTAAETIRKADWRFASLAVEQRSGTLVISGTAPRASDAWDLAQSLRQVPGVVRVVVGNVGVK